MQRAVGGDESQFNTHCQQLEWGISHRYRAGREGHGRHGLPLTPQAAAQGIRCCSHKHARRKPQRC